MSMVTESTDGCAVLTGEEVEVVGGLAVHTVQEDCTIALTKTARKIYICCLVMHESKKSTSRPRCYTN